MQQLTQDARAHCKTGKPTRLAHTIPIATLLPSQCATKCDTCSEDLHVCRSCNARLPLAVRLDCYQHGIVGAGNTRPPKLSRPA